MKVNYAGARPRVKHVSAQKLVHSFTEIQRQFDKRWRSGLAVCQPRSSVGFESRRDDTEVPRKGDRTAK
jgi:hypothetical protein